MRAEMLQLTPRRADIDRRSLSRPWGTNRLHVACPAQLLAALARRVEATLAISVLIGLSDYMFLAELASDLDKPRGFAVHSRREAADFIADKPVSMLCGGRAPQCNGAWPVTASR